MADLRLKLPSRTPTVRRKRQSAFDSVETRSRALRTNDERWGILREVILHRDPICKKCERAVSTDVDHIDGNAHNNDEDNLQGLCKSCHSKKTWREDYALIPDHLSPSAIPLTIVCGPAGSGKTTFCQKHAQEGDLIIDLDFIQSELSGLPLYHADKREHFLAAIKRRNQILRSLSFADMGQAFFIVSAPRAYHRRKWIQMLRPMKTVVLATDLSTCIQRIRADHRRGQFSAQYEALARKWWNDYSELPSDVVVTY